MKDIGSCLKHLRKSKNKTLKDISEKVNLSTSFLSQLEHNKCSVTIESLMKISEALDVNPSFFFSDKEEKEIKKNAAINKINTNDEKSVVSNFSYKDLSGTFPNQSFLPTLVTLQPRKEGVRPLSHKGQEFIFILSGKLTIILDYDEITLEVGESMHMESTVPHNWINNTDKNVEFLYMSAR